MDVFILQHSYVVDEVYDETKIIGIYSSEAKAQEVAAAYQNLPGFNQFPADTFFIDRYPLDENNWEEGFIQSTD